MNGSLRLLLAFVCALFLLSKADAKQTSVGTYSNGCILRSTPLPKKVKGIRKINPDRKRHYGNRTLVQLLKDLGKAYRKEFPAPHENIHVADLTSRKGGPQRPQHSSHQNGLDADIIYLRHDHRESKLMDEDFVKDGEVTENFDLERNWWMLRYLISSGSVSRIFVNPVIKKRFCDYSSSLEPNAERRTVILRHLRPWYGHSDHLHLRLLCPAKDKNCIGNHWLPDGDGCDDPVLSDGMPERKEKEHPTKKPEKPKLCR